MKPLRSEMFYRNRKEVIMYDNLHLTNMLRSEVEHIPESGLPLDAFPDKIQEILVSDSIGETREAWLSLLGETFSTGDGIVAGKKVEMSRRTVYYALEQLCRLQNPIIEKIRHGVYQKTASENTNASCTIALSLDKNTGQSSQSAKVQSATQINSDSHE